MPTTSIFRAALIALPVVAGLQTGESHATDRYTRSASWTSCQVLRSMHGQQTLPGLLARQWIIGYLSGAAEAAPPSVEPAARSGDAIMEEVRRYCQAHPQARAVEAAENALPPGVLKP